MPLTHDLLMATFAPLDAQLTHVEIYDLREDTFHGRIYLQVGSTPKGINCRVSDALALAVRGKVPIYAAESVLEKAGLLLDKETGKSTTGQ